MSTGVGKVTEGLKSKFNQFGSNKYVAGTKNFLQSNTLVAKFAFLILAIIVFFMLLSIGSSIIKWIFSPSPSPILIKGMIDAKRMKVIEQDPSVTGSIPILRSGSGDPGAGPGSGPGVDDSGMEFTWSVWIYVDDFTYKQGEYKHVFHKGNLQPAAPGGEDAGLSMPNNAPGLYITPNTNGLLVIMNSFTNIKEEVEIQDLPLNKWVNVIIRLRNQRQLDVYINGVLTERKMLSDVARQNYGKVYVAANGGFDGFIDSLRYFNWAIGVNKIQEIVDAGPDLTARDNDLSKSVPHYLSTRWFFTGLGDEYNPRRTSHNLHRVMKSASGM